MEHEKLDEPEKQYEPEKQDSPNSLIPEIISEDKDENSHHSSEYKPFTRRRAAKANRK